MFLHADDRCDIQHQQRGARADVPRLGKQYRRSVLRGAGGGGEAEPHKGQYSGVRGEAEPYKGQYSGWGNSAGVNTQRCLGRG